MAQSIVIRPLTATLGLSVGATSHAAVALPANQDQCNYVNVVNTSTTLYVAVTLSAAQTASTIPGDGTTGSYVIGPNQSVNLAAPIANQASIYATAIASGAGPTLVLFTPIGSQS